MVDFNYGGNSLLTIKNAVSLAAAAMNFDIGTAHIMTLLGSGNVG